MRKDPYRSRLGWFGHFLYLGLMPPFIHACSSVLFALEAEAPFLALVTSAFAAAATGSVLKKKKYGALASAVAGAWPAALAAGYYWYGNFGLYSPGGPAQALARALGWRDAPAAVAVALALLPCGVAGWALLRFDTE